MVAMDRRARLARKANPICNNQSGLTVIQPMIPEDITVDWQHFA
jgi:hypothetical protein